MLRKFTHLTFFLSMYYLSWFHHAMFWMGTLDPVFCSWLIPVDYSVDVSACTLCYKVHQSAVES